MKRLTAVICTVCLVLGLAACGGGGTGEDFAPEDTGTLQLTGESLAAGDDGYQEEAERGAEGEAPREPEPEEEPQPEPEGPGTLIVFFSRHGNALDSADAVTSASYSAYDVTVLAEMIEQNIQADLHQIITADPYPAAYDECTAVAQTELDEDARPALANSVENMDRYDVIYLGYPIWWGDIPMPVATFLESYQFSGKTIVPFCTHGGSGMASSASRVAELAPGATVLEGLAVRGDQADAAGDAVEQWINSLGL